MKVGYKEYEKVLMELGNYTDQVIMSGGDSRRYSVKLALSHVLGGVKKVGSPKDAYGASMISYLVKNWETDWKKCATLVIVWRVTNFKKEDLLIEVSPTVKIFFSKNMRARDILKLLGYS